MQRRGVLFGAWALATAAATLVAWAAVRQVTEEVAAPTVLPVPSAVAIVDQSEGTQRPPTVITERPEARSEPPPVRQPPPDQPAENEQDQADAQSITEAYRLTGGVVTVRYRSGDTNLVSASPNSGFDVDVHDPGPGKVDVRFRSDDHESRLVTRWHSGAPDPEKDERPR